MIGSNKRKRICIVDDDETLIVMLEDHLSQNPSYYVETFPTGDEFLQLISDTCIPDVIILDFNLNSIKEGTVNGREVLQQIKNHNQSIRAVMYSSPEQYGKAFETISSGAIEYTIKENGAFEKINHLIKTI